jgi:hypothetical protein
VVESQHRNVKTALSLSPCAFLSELAIVYPICEVAVHHRGFSQLLWILDASKVHVGGASLCPTFLLLTGDPV